MTDEQLAGFYDCPPPPDAWQRCAEKRELLRIAARGMLQNPRLDPLARPFAEHWAAQAPLTAPLTEGEDGKP
jgi:hypothetical protein